MAHHGHLSGCLAFCHVHDEDELWELRSNGYPPDAQKHEEARHSNAVSIKHRTLWIQIATATGLGDKAARKSF